MWTHTAREDNLLVEDKLLCPGCPILTINLSGPRRSSTIHALLGAWDTILTLQFILFSTLTPSRTLLLCNALIITQKHDPDCQLQGKALAASSLASGRMC
jgi:hypothetical protein